MPGHKYLSYITKLLSYIMKIMLPFVFAPGWFEVPKP